MLKIAVLAAVGAALALSAAPALAQQGTSSSYGSVGWGPVIPTQSLTPRDRAWNVQNQAKYHAEESAEWLRQHGQRLFSFFR